jgi:hypothetical protein
MKHIIYLLLFPFLLALTSCKGSSTSNESIIGTWVEHRADPNDDYGLGRWKFNGDGSGMFIVKGYTNTQRVAFTWERSGRYIKVNMNGDIETLELNNGLLIEESSFGTTVYKK